MNEHDTTLKAPDRATVNVDEAAALLGLSRSSGYAAARNGDLPVIRVGRRLLVPVAALNRMLEGVNHGHPANSLS
jgi:excisionase family DNA binding protein